MNWMNIALENLLAFLPIELASPVQWWAQVHFGTMDNITLYLLAVVPALLGLAVGAGLGIALARAKTIPLATETKQRIEIILCAVLLLPGVPFKALMLAFSGMFGVRLWFAFACAAVAQLAHFYIAVFITRDSATLGWTLKFLGFL